MATKLYVGNLAYATTEAELRQVFARAGAVVAVHLVTDRAGGQAKGFAFVTMGSPAEAQAAIRQFHRTRLAGRSLTVKVAQDQERAKPARSDAEPAYQSRFGAFGGSGITPVRGPRRSGKPPAAGGYQSRYTALGDQTAAPAQPRRRSRRSY
ncbi:MAG: hypothetical protein JNK29_04915 [Anaerolineales bacterium]|nr:hypothetical protein [Anaerolineales bacterium]